MHAISKGRFEALASYARGPLAGQVAREFAWFESDDGRLVATVFVDTAGEFVSVVLAPDPQERFRAVHVDGEHSDAASAQLAMERFAEAALIADFDELRRQDDDERRPVDFFSPVVPDERLHANFRSLAFEAGFSAAREVVESMMRWHDDVDGNFIEQFQTSGFDARMWELYLFAALGESSLAIERPKPAPDFFAWGIHGALAVEATTVNPSVIGGKPAPSVRPAPGDDETPYRHHYLPIRFAGPLTAKLAKRDWANAAVAGHPFAIAIQDFHDSMSMTYSGSALPEYLYGLRHESQIEEDGSLVVTPVPVTEHRWGRKVVPSGFFSLPEAENVSAVMFNALGTISKFNRMGVQAGFGREGVQLIHVGTVADPNPDAQEPRGFREVVTTDSSETWGDGMSVFHNPNAARPLDPRVLPNAAHHRLRPDGQLVTTAGKPPVIASRTAIVVAK